MPLDRGLVAHTLHDERDLNPWAALFEDLPTAKPDPEMVKLARQLIERQAGEYDPADSEDRYEARLREVIEAKLKGEGIEPEAEDAPDRGNVVDLMAALRRSLEPTGKATRAPTAKAKSPPKKTKTAAATSKRQGAGQRARRT